MRKITGFIMFVALTIAALAPAALAFTPDSLVWQKCTGCHEPVNGKIPKIEEIRTTPEEWTVVLDRMSRLYGVGINKAEMDTLLKELCSTQILSPEELDKVSYLNLYNNPQTVEEPVGAEQQKMFVTCVRCHSAGKILSYRMTGERWGQLREFHLYQVPTVLYQMREMKWMDESVAVLKALSRSAGYGKAWKAPAAKPSGNYVVIGYEPGRGNYRGQATVTERGGSDYLLNGSLTFEDGTSEHFKGEGTFYGGHALRTRASHNGVKSYGAYSFTGGVIRGEHHFPAPDFRTSSSAWYPAGGKARLVKVSPGYLVAGESTTLRLEGIGLPEVKADDVRFSDGSVQVVSARRVGPGTVEVVARYQGNANRKAEVRVRGLEPLPVSLAAQIDFIRITPELGRARVAGGSAFPPEGVQFEALAYAGELPLGPVPARFKLTAQNKRPNDDDIAWVGAITPAGKYIPIGTYGPIESREFHAEGTGLVNVEAEYKRGDRAYLAKARLAVTLPDFVPRIK